ncbi:Epimerase family protein SA0724 [Actinobacillus ureae]|uniref:TIGR01777 family oxidoreductase n=1 Tax=Actinobacillus ureae TaxID=723 RepID=UPI000E1B3D61|nr:TIGR01777 family oxidoreductase [Actinobacillus ureae]SUT87205.1 Epimerase family protein SA0724 [Actinobacillus ureae]SUU48185.1 Epimerase family protein SA0724 [Actinobacillus ureae]
MKILITGGTGFIGRHLVEALLEEGHALTLVTHQSNPKITFTQAVEFCQNLASLESLDGFDAVINLAGEPIFNRAWTPEQKQRLSESRLQTTSLLAQLIQASRTPPHTFISGSATGYYGNVRSDSLMDESAACDTNFSAELCRQWEAAALTVESPRTRVCLIRTGIVLAPQGGVLLKMLPLYRLNLAGKLGSGQQHWAWIALEDHIQAVLFLLKNANCRGAFNLVAPHPVTNAEFNARLAAYLKRCAWFAVPAFILKLVLGERSQLLLDNQPLTPAKLLVNGFRFRLLDLDFKQIFEQ